ncbi:MAG: glycerol-3-phosphate 1-O-acyltransferase PlsY [Candidatus Caenarcaniphilales bacterium]|nr:glycerol-3-phosphate 1-O-acyltransferase PlsY [Candidatus Caenarcaniphilales bacterium]
MNYLLVYLFPLFVGYLFGSLPFGFIVGKFHGVDLTQAGSGSTGTTNVLRNLGKGSAALVFFGDFGKGVVAPLLTGYLIGLWLGSESVCDQGIAKTICALGVLVGHAKSLWIGFKGGKSVAAGVGTLFALDWRIGIIVGLIWLMTVAISRYSSLGALIGWCAAPLTTYTIRSMLISGELCETFLTWIFTGYAFIGALYIIYKHRANIYRLMHGEEPKIGQSKN